MELVQTMKLHIHPEQKDMPALSELMSCYTDACNYISRYIFEHGFVLNFMSLQEQLYKYIRNEYGLKAQFTISSFKTVTARYKAIATQLAKKPYKYKDENGKWQKIPRTLEWLTKSVHFARPQADFVRNRDYSFVKDKNGQTLLSLNTLGKRIKVPFDMPDCFSDYFKDGWNFGGGKLVTLKGRWYFHISMTKEADFKFDQTAPVHVVGIDRGLRFLATTYDEKGRTRFFDGKTAMAKRDSFQKVRDELQSKGTKSAKRALKRISGRENRWMDDINHSITKTLVNRYGSDTLFVLEDLTDVSFCDENLHDRSKKQKKDLRSWSFYQFESFLTYKAHAVGSEVIKVDAHYTSQRCPKCGRILKENRHHDIHTYICDCCGYSSNDDRIGAMNIQQLGAMYVSGDTNPRFGTRKEN